MTHTSTEAMPYEAWRIAYQSSEAAARAAHARVQELKEQLANANQSSGAEAYDIACEEMEAFQRKRAQAGKEVGCTGSLVDGMGWMYERLDELEAAQAQRVPQGWRLVPVKPTQEMIDSVANVLQDELLGVDATNQQIKEDWASLLAAAPQPPAAECITCSGHGAVGNPTNAEPCPDCTPRGHLADVAPVQLPEPELFAINTSPKGSESKHYEHVATEFRNDPDVVRFYAEQQVRQLLAR